ncbi:MAG: cellulose biosynthesis protein BcsG, partial [Legionellales bacterium]
TWLPSIYALKKQDPNVFQFNSDFLLDLLTRFISWEMIGVGFILLVAYLFVSQWLRVTTFTVAILCWLNYTTLNSPLVNTYPVPANILTNKGYARPIAQDANALANEALAITNQ